MKTDYLDDNGEIVQRQTFLRTPNNHDTQAEALNGALMCKDPSKAQQSSKEETDINTIVDRFLKTGQMPNIQLPPHFGDFTDVEGDYLMAQTRVAETNALFYKLRPEIRSEYQNNPGRWQSAVLQAFEVGDAAFLADMGIDVKLAQKNGQLPQEPAPGGNPPDPKGGTPEPAKSAQEPPNK